MYQTVLFDLDGTLTAPDEGITKCVQHALAYFSIQAEKSELLRFIGPPLKDSFMQFYHLSEQDALVAIEKYRERYATVGIFENRLFDGIEDTLRLLRSQNRTIALATSKPLGFARQILERFGILAYFDVVCGAKMHGNETKADIIAQALAQANADLQTSVMVGDRKHDVIGAAKNAIDCVGVYFGYAEEGELEAAGAKYVVNTVDELNNLFLTI